MRIELGAGPASPRIQNPDWKTNDIRRFPGIDFVCPCYNLLMVKDNSVEEMCAEGVIEHLRYCEVARGLVEWKRILKVGGFMTFDVPDLELYISAYLGKLGQRMLTNAENGGNYRVADEPDDHDLCTGKERWLRRALYGWQRWEGDEHKSGWTKKLITGYINKYFKGRYVVKEFGSYWGHTDAEVKHLWVRCWKDG